MAKHSGAERHDDETDDELDPAVAGEPTIPDGIGPDELDEIAQRSGRYPATIFEILALDAHGARVAALRDAGISPEIAADAVIERALDELVRLERVPGYSLRTAPTVRRALRDALAEGRVR